MKQVLVYGMTSNPGGIEAYLLQLFRRQQDRGAHFDFVSDFSSVSGGEEITAAGGKIWYIPAKSRDLWGHLKGMWDILRAHPEYGTLYCNVLDAGAAVTMLPAFLLGRRIVVHSHNGATDKVRLHKLCRPVLNCMARGRVACSRTAAEHLFGRKGERALLMPNAISVERFRYREALRRESRAALEIGDEPVFLHVGRLAPQKNPMGLLDIFGKIYERRPDALLLSVGTGELEEAFRREIRDRGLENAVRCLGVREDIPALLQAADVFLLPSLYEGLPISALEAQAAGLPCLLSDAVTPEVALTDRVRRLFLAAGPKVWAETALTLLESERADGAEALRKAGFDSDHCEAFDEALLKLF